jgi:hypothetical protein
VEQHDCYIRLAPCHAALNLRHPSNEKELRAVLLREPERIRLQGWNSLDINFTKDLSLLMLHAIHSLSTSGFLKKTRLWFKKKKTYKKSVKREKLESVRE